jgi:hypothetical protein
MLGRIYPESLNVLDMTIEIRPSQQGWMQTGWVEFMDKIDLALMEMYLKKQLPDYYKLHRNPNGGAVDTFIGYNLSFNNTLKECLSNEILQARITRALEKVEP